MENSQTDPLEKIVYTGDTPEVKTIVDLINENIELLRYKKAWEDLRDSSSGKIHEYAKKVLNEEPLTDSPRRK